MSKLKVIMSYANNPIDVEIIQDANVKESSYYVVSDGSYTIKLTEEQKNERIKLLEAHLEHEREQLKKLKTCLTEILKLPTWDMVYDLEDKISRLQERLDE